MMTSKVFNIALFCFLSTAVVAQYRLTGTVISREDTSAVHECPVYLNDGDKYATTDSRGKFLFGDLPNGSYTLHFTSLEFNYYKTVVIISNTDQHIRVLLEPRHETLEEVTVTDASPDFGFTRMRAVESMGIYEGKKSEVIIPEQLVANLSTNNARQVYSRVAGLNIWENDGAGLQLSIGGRGLDPNRTSNFNTRQNGYDISADALGYPESYYTPPTEGVGRIQIVRGAASLQYGTQFGGLINFNMKKPVADRKIELIARQTAGSFGFYNAFTSASGTINKLSYYTFFQYKQGDGWRENSHFDNHTLYANINYAVSEKTKAGIDITQMGYLAQQPGGLSDEMFEENPRQSNRERNWFKVNWNLFALHFDHKFSSSSEFNLRLFGLSAYRYSVGFRPNRVATIDDNSERDLIKGDFKNWGIEARYLKRYSIGKMSSVVLAGSRYYHGFNHSTQGLGSTGKDADFNYVNGDEYISYDYRFPNRNVSVFLENILFIHEKLSLTPGIRYEHINTTADGFYGTIYKDLAGNIIAITRTEEERHNARQFLLAGLGVSYKPTSHIDVYSNISQNYRSITFSDMRISNPSSVIDPNLEDEKGYSFDLGMRSEQTTLFNYDVSLFYMNYDNRIGEVQFYDDNNRVLRRRGNIGRAVIQGIEAYGEIDLLGYLYPKQDVWSGVVFNNVALIHSQYKKSDVPEAVGNKVEFVPDMNLKSGLRLGYKYLKASFQYTYLSDQFTDATNATDGGVSAVIGTIPAYSIMDVSLSYQYKKFRVEGSINNLLDRMYFTRRATGYPGPGILPSDGRSFYLTLQVMLRKS
jgi:Fe(3+) dicitrate transport protein